MSTHWPEMGEGYTPAYQISAIPFVTSSTITLGQIKQISFPQVTKFLTIKNTGASTNVLAVGFSQNGLLPANSNYFILSGSESFTGEFRVDRMFLSGTTATSFSLIAGLTGIPVKNFTVITGSNGYLGVG